MSVANQNKSKKICLAVMAGFLAFLPPVYAMDGKTSPSSAAPLVVSSYALEKKTIVGGGVMGVLSALWSALNAQQKGEKLRITIYEKNPKITDTTCTNIAPSLTVDEIASVIPPVPELLQALKTPFNEPEGIRIMDVAGIEESASGQRFLAEVAAQGKDQAGINARQKMLLLLGKMSMDLWVTLYEKADPELRAIFEASNFMPCRDPQKGEEPLAHGYRIDLLYGMENVEKRVTDMKTTYQGLGYHHCRLLSPEEAMKKDPSLSGFCKLHSTFVNGKRAWKKDSAAILRPGGCINAFVFIPQVVAYLTRKMGTYVNAHGVVKNCFQFRLNREITAVKTDTLSGQTVITGLAFAGGYQKKGNHIYPKKTYVFCPGEAVKMLENFGFKAPAYAGFAGASLILRVKVPKGKENIYKAFVHCMEVHKPGIVLAWQAKADANYMTVAVAGTKAFYADKTPHITEAFAVDRNLVQLNMINDVLPGVLSLALNKDTTGKTLTQSDMTYLERAGIAKRWVGVRAVTFDGVPTVSHVYLSNGEKIENGIVVTHLGSGGISFGPAAAALSHFIQDDSKSFSERFRIDHSLVKAVLKYTDSARTAIKAN